MPPARRVAQRAATNENDENAQHARVTRAKTAALGTHDELTEGAVRKALQTKKSGANTVNGAQTQRKRAALGDLSNVAKGVAGDDAKEEKKAQAKITVGAKASQTAGVQKASRPTTGRAALGSKDSNKKAGTELKRPASGSGVMGAATKKRSSTAAATATALSQPSIKEDPATEESERPKKKVMKVEVQETVTIEQEELHLEDDAAINSAAQDIEIPDLDADDMDDPLMVSEYANEIFTYLRSIEEQSQPNSSYMDYQDHCEWTDRDILNDWLVQVHQRFQLLPETLYLAVNIVDRFLSQKIVQLDKLQLVGITALFIASKYEEVVPPHVSNFTYMAKDYADTEILSAERFILATLNYDLSYPNPMNFLRRISKADTYDMQTRTLGKYMLEISTLDHRFLQFPPSQVAAASMFMSRMILERGEWNPTIAHYAGYTAEEIEPVFKLLVDYCSGEIKHEAFHSKYAGKKYLKASLLVRQWAERYVAKFSSKEFFARDIQY